MRYKYTSKKDNELITNIIDCRNDRFIAAHIAATILRNHVSLAIDIADPKAWDTPKGFYDIEADISVEEALIWAGQYDCPVVLFLHDIDCEDFEIEQMQVMAEACYSAVRSAEGMPFFGFIPGVTNGYRDGRLARRIA